ncbi:unnamed protein product, partial [Coregonus sp. 'balchen']
MLQKLRLQTRLDGSCWWIIDYNEITIIKEAKGALALSLSTTASKTGSGGSYQTLLSSTSYGLRDNAGKEHIYSTIGLFQGNQVAIKYMQNQPVSDIKKPSIIAEFNVDVLRCTDIELDWMFKLSFAYDIVNGMEYIHKSSLKSHGNLKPSTCLVDSRLQVKLSGFGLWEFKYGTKHKVIPLENPKFE